MKALIPLVLIALTSMSFAQNDSFGSFTYTERIDPMSDLDTSYVFTTDSTSRSSSTGILFWRCMEDGLNIVFSPDEYLNSDESVSVRYRFDKLEPSDIEQWELMTSGTAVWMPLNQIDSFTTDAKAADQIVMQATSYDDETYTYNFDLDGLTDALNELSCAI